MSKNLKFSAIDTRSYNPLLGIEGKARNGDYVTWGEKNGYPEYLYDIYSNCATLQSIINGSVNYTMGSKMINNTNFKDENRFGETLEEVIEKLVVDRWIFGGFCFQVLYNPFGQVTEICYLDFRKVRTDKDGNTVYVSNEWTGWGSNRATKFKSYNPETAIEDGLQVYYYKGSKTRSVYPKPDYEAALVSAETQIEIQKFDYNNLINNFMSNTIINFNAGEQEDDIKREVEKAINNKFAGSENAGRVFVNWNDSKETAIEVTKLSGDTMADQYASVAESSRENLFISLNAHPNLFGMNIQTGFNSQEYKDAYELYYTMQIIPKQNEIIKIFNRVFKNQYDGLNSIEFIKQEIDFKD